MPGQSYQWHSAGLPCAGYLAPVPPPAVPIDCWLPGDEEQPGGEGLLCDLQAMLQQLRCELKDIVDARLAAHHEDVLRRVLDEPQVLPSALKLKPEDAAPELLAGLESLDFSSAGALDAEGEEAARGQLRRSLGSFESTERSKQQAIRLLPNKHWRGPTFSARISERKERLPAKVRKLLESQCCEFLVGFLILTNVLFLGAEVQVARGAVDGDVPLVFKVAEYSYAAFFSLELLLRILAYGPAYFLQPETQWNIIDFVLVAAFVLEKVMKVFLDVESNLHYLRIIRVARTVRVLRVVRLVAFFRPLRILVYSVMNTLRSLAWTFVLLIIIIYLFAVTFTLAAARGTAPPSPELETFFGSLWTSMALLFKAICGGLDWAVVSDALGELGYLWSFLFLAYIAFCNLAMLNVVTGVVCHTAIESTRQDQDIVVQSQLAIKQRYVQQLQQLFAEFDPGETGEITLREFESRISDEELKHYFEVLELTIDEAWSLFKLLDSRGRGIVSLEEFVSGCLKLRGNARSIDMHMLMYQSKWTMDRLACLMESVSELEGIMEGMRPPSRWTTGRLSRGGSRGSMQDVSTPTA